MAKILTVDDDVKFATLISDMLTHFGYSSDFVTESERFFSALENDRYDLVLIDVHMPGVDGVTLLKQLKIHSEFSDIPVVMLTGDIDDQLLAVCFESGAEDFITKPISHLVLRARIDNILSMHRYIRQLKATRIQMAQAEKMASLGEMLSGIAHEINTPLGIINSNNDLLIRYLKKICERERDDPNILGILAKMEHLTLSSNTACSSILSISDSLRVFARADQANYEAVALDSLIDITLEIMKNKLKNSIIVKKDYGHIEPVNCYPGRLIQVFINIINNAYDAMAEKGVLRISVKKNGDHVNILFCDSGPGIPENIREKIFDPGFTTKGVGIGTGLGLSISTRIIEEMHHGRLHAENHSDGGLCVSIELPLKNEPVREDWTESPIAEEI